MNFKNIQFSTDLIITLSKYNLSRKDVGHCAALLNRINYLVTSRLKDGKLGNLDGIPAITVSCKTLRSELGPGYLQTLLILENEGLLLRGSGYTVGTSTVEGRCRLYAITERGQKLLNAVNKHYLHHILNDPKARRAIQISTCKRKIRSKMYDIGVVDYIHATICHVDFNQEVVTDLLEKLPIDKANASHHHLIAIIERKWKDLEVNEKTGRIYNPLNMICKEIRRNFSINGKKYAREVDIRACHMTFLADYIQEHIATGLDLSAEVKKWRDIFCGNEPPKAYMARELKLQVETVKDMMNTTINGGRRKGTKRFFRWMEDEFPGLYGQWIREGINIKKTGVNISKHYEQKIFRSDAMIQLAKTHQIEIIDAHDALFIFGDSSNAKLFSDEMKALAKVSAGFNLQFSEDEINPETYNPNKDLGKLRARLEIAQRKSNLPGLDDRKRQGLARRVQMLEREITRFIIANKVPDKMAA